MSERAARALSARTPVGNVGAARMLASELARRGVQLRIEDGALRWRSAPGRMDVPTLRRLKQAEPALIELVRGDGGR